jgi:hypothetical protein
MKHNDHPAPGDVLITTETGVHFLSVVPYHQRLSFTELDRATDLALQWAKANHTRAWRTVDGQTSRLGLGKRAAESRT